MKKEEKSNLIDSLAEQLQAYDNFYLTDIGSLDSVTTSKLRRLCFRRNVKLRVVKNTLLQKALERSGKDVGEIFTVLKGATSIMFSETGNAPAKLIKEFRKSSNIEKPILKAAFVQESCYIGNDQLELLINLKSKTELIGDIIFMLQSPACNVVSALQSGGGKLAGIVKTLSEKPE